MIEALLFMAGIATLSVFYYLEVKARKIAAATAALNFCVAIEAMRHAKIESFKFRPTTTANILLFKVGDEYEARIVEGRPIGYKNL